MVPGVEGSRGKGQFTRHPIDLRMHVGKDALFDDWNVRIEQEQYQDWYKEQQGVCKVEV
jgi:hypothetical protein